MEVEEIIKSVEESFENRSCKYVDLIGTKIENNPNDSFIEDRLKSEGYPIFVSYSHDRDKTLFNYRIRIKNKK